MSISFQEFDVQQFRAEIAKMSDTELINLGRSLRSLCYPRVVALDKTTFDSARWMPGGMAQATFTYRATARGPYGTRQSPCSLLNSTIRRFMAFVGQRTGPAHISQAQVEAEMTHKLTGREIYDALCVQGQGDIGEYIAGISSAWIDGKVCFDALALRLNEIIVANGNHDAVVRAITGED